MIPQSWLLSTLSCSYSGLFTQQHEYMIICGSTIMVIFFGYWCPFILLSSRSWGCILCGIQRGSKSQRTRSWKRCSQLLMSQTVKARIEAGNRLSHLRRRRTRRTRKEKDLSRVGRSVSPLRRAHQRHIQLVHKRVEHYHVNKSYAAPFHILNPNYCVGVAFLPHCDYHTCLNESSMYMW